MASKEFNVIAILYPKKGKTDEVYILYLIVFSSLPTSNTSQVLGLMKEVAEYTQAKEPGVLTYSINRSLRPNKDGTEEIVMIEKFVSSLCCAIFHECEI